jgi:hypothetical protein
MKMKVLLYFRTLFRIVPALILFLLISCSDSSSPESQWESIGVHQVAVDQIDIPNTNSTADTLLIELAGSTVPSGRLTLSSIDDVRVSDRVTLVIWAEVEKWIGSGIMPTIDPTVQCTYRAIPPFDEGMFYLVIEQPDGSELVDSVLIEN